jgi:hypothetical protein
MASRSFDQPDGIATVSHVYTPIIGDCPLSYTVTEVNKIRRGEYAGAETPQYHRKLAEGAMLPLNAYMRFDFQEDRPHGDYGGIYYRPSPERSYAYDVNSVRSVDGATSTKDDAIHMIGSMSSGLDITALHQQAAADALPDLDALTTLVEARETVGMLVNARNDAKRLILEALKGGKHTVKAASDAWLAWRYGWQTLGMDIEAAVDVYNYPIRQGLAVEGRAGVSFAEVVKSNNPFSGYYVIHDYETVLKRDLSVRVNVVARVEGQSLNVLVSPTVTGWEMIPYSFVADWFVSVGDALKAWTLVASASRVYSSLGYKFTEDGSSTVTNVTDGTGTYATNPHASGGAQSKTECKIRVPLGNVNLIPRIRVNLTTQRLLDAAALLSKRIL